MEGAETSAPHRLDPGGNGFAAPYWDLDERFFAAVVSSYYREYLRLFVDRNREHLARKSIGLLDLLEEAAEQPWPSFEQAWHFSLAAARDAVVESASLDEALRVAVSVGGAILASRNNGEFRVTGSLSAAPFWRDSIASISPVQLQLTCTTDEAQIEVRRNCQSTSDFSFQSDDWSDRSKDLPLVQSSNIKLRLLTGTTARWIGCETPPNLSVAELDDAHKRILAAATLLENHTPRFAKWVGRVLRFISPIESPVGIMRSGSGRQWPGVAEISFRCTPIAIAEMLVHEASHQYYNILLMLDSVADGTDRHLYYSPIRKCERPLEMILLAYHAFSNVLFFYRECQSSGLEDGGFCKKNEEELVPDLMNLQDTLQSATSLTEVGDALWRPLAPQICINE
jgi:hypothetical protein